MISNEIQVVYCLRRLLWKIRFSTNIKIIFRIRRSVIRTV